MSQDAAQFADTWASENVYVDAYDPPAGVIDDFVNRLVEAADGQGISREDLEGQVGDLHDFIAERFEDATDNEVERLASRDD